MSVRIGTHILKVTDGNPKVDNHVGAGGDTAKCLVVVEIVL